MAEIFNSDKNSAEDIENRFCDPENVKLNSERQLTFIATDPLSKIIIWRRFLEKPTYANDTESDDHFDLPEQAVIDEDCERFINECDFPAEIKERKLLVLRKVITVYSKSEHESYKSGNGWIHLLGRIISEHNSVLDIYKSFKNIKDTYVPTPQTPGFILELLLRYHDPGFYKWIKEHKISLNECTESWFTSLFAENCTKPVCDFLWESFIKSNDSFGIFFIALSMIHLQKSNLETIEKNSKEQIKNTISQIANIITTEDLIDVLERTKKYDINTPPFFREAFSPFMFGDQRKPIPQWLPLLLPLSVTTMIETLRGLEPPNIVSDYFIVDCRPSNQYAGGHFSFNHKYHVDCNTFIKSSTGTFTINDIHLLMLRIEEAENTSKIKEIHICLIGSNMVTTDKCVHTVAGELLKNNKRYVSMLYGGYEIIHKTLKAQEEFDVYAIDHIERKCIVCSPMRKKFISRMKKNFLNSKKSLLTCINSIDDDCQNADTNIVYEFDIAESKKNMFAEKKIIFPTLDRTSIDGDIYGVVNPSISSGSDHLTYDEGFEGKTHFDLVVKSDYLTLPGVKIHECTEITSDGHEFDGLLLITDTNLVHLRMIKDFRKNAYLIVNCHLFCVMNIRRDVNEPNLMIILFETNDQDQWYMKEALLHFEQMVYKIRNKEKFSKDFKERYDMLTAELNE